MKPVFCLLLSLLPAARAAAPASLTYSAVSREAQTLREAGCAPPAVRRMTADGAAVFYRNLAQRCEALLGKLRELDHMVDRLAADAPLSPADDRMRRLRRELADKLSTGYFELQRSAGGVAEQAGLMDVARRTRLLHMVDIELGEASGRQTADQRDPRLRQLQHALRTMQIGAAELARHAAAVAEGLHENGPGGNDRR